MMYDDVDPDTMYDVVLRLEVCIITVEMILRSRWRRAQAGSVDDYWCMIEHSGGFGSTENNFEVLRSPVQVAAAQNITSMYDGAQWRFWSHRK